VPPSTYRPRALSLLIHQAPGFELSLANLQSYESGLHSGYSTTDSPSLFHHDDTFEFA
jgi:hypothetical protein